MDTKALRQKILDLAIRGKLVPQDPNDEPASVLLERIRAEKQQMVKDGKLKAKDIKNDTVIFKGDDNLHYEQFADGTVKCIEDEIPFELPNGWAWARLGNIGEIITGGTPSKSHHEYYGNAFPFFKPADLDQGRKTIISSEYLSEKGKSCCRIIPKFSTAVCCIGSIGKCGYLNVEGTTNQQINSVIPNIDSLYAYYYCSSDYFLEQLLSLASATTIAIVNKSKMESVLIPVPPMVEQKKIANTLDTALGLIETLEVEKSDIIVAINSVKSKILDLAIRGKLVPQNPNDEPASVLLERIRAEKEELIKQGKIKRDKKESVIFKGDDNSYYEKYGEKLPSGWVVTNFETLLEYEQPTKYIVNDTNYKPTYKTPVLTAGKSFILGYTNETDNIFDDLPVIIFDDFTTESKFVDFPFKVKSSAMKILHANQDLVLPKYAFYLMQATEIDHENHQRYWISTFSQEIVALPPIMEQERILTTLEHYFNLLDTLH